MSDEITFQIVIDALADAKPFPARLLPRFSDLTPAELKALRAAWTSLPAKRKHRLLADLAELAEEDTLLSFDALGVDLLDDPDQHVRAGALRLLAENDDPRLGVRFAAMLTGDESGAVRAAAANALGPFVQLGELDEIPEEAQAQIEAALLGVVTGPDSVEVRRLALEALGYSSRPEVIALLEEAAARADPQWVASALTAMGRSSDERWQGVVLLRLADADPRVRLRAVQAAGELALTRARVPLLALLEEDDDNEILAAAIWSLSQIGGEDVRVYLTTLLDRAEDDDLAAFLEEALENLDFTEDLGHFNLMAVDPDDELIDDDGE